MALRWGFVAGALAGAAAGLMLAPKAGNVTRRWVRMKSGRYIKYAKETRQKLPHVALPFFGRATEGATDENYDGMEGFCFKCEAKRTMVNAAEALMSDGRLSLRGECSVCGGGMSRLIKG